MTTKSGNKLNKDNHWSLGFAMPNVIMDGGFEFDDIAIVGGTDKRLQNIIKQNKAAGFLLKGFYKSLGKGKLSSAIIYRNPQKFENLDCALVDAKNSLALACCCNGWVNSIGRTTNFSIRYSDHFDFYPRIASDDGQLIEHAGPASSVYSNPRGFIGLNHQYLFINEIQKPSPDEQLLNHLICNWKLKHIKRKSDTRVSLLFRSLALAFEACRVPQSMSTPIYDHGKNCSLWVSAFETLAQSGNWSGKKPVLEMIAKRNFTEPRIKCKRKIKIGKLYELCNIVQRLYLNIYFARNNFIHGNKIKDRDYAPRILKNGIRLIDAAPLVFQTALEGFLLTTKLAENISLRQANPIMDLLKLNPLETAFLRSLK
jgi:hypothetical protein